MSNQLTVGMYAHHQGSGHIQRCTEIAHHLEKRGARVTILSSAEKADVVLPLDLPEGPDPTAHGSIHWAPLGVQGMTDRMAIIAAWVAEHRPAVFYVDCSVEVALFVRLLGVPVVTIAMPGERPDPPHQLGYQQASALIAAWPAVVDVPAHLSRWQDKLHCVGGISRFAQGGTLEWKPEGAATQACEPTNRPHVVVMSGRGGTNRLPNRADWLYLGGDNHVDNPLDYLASADVIVTASGQNSIADIASVNKPVIVIPQDRAFNEQHATARALRNLGLAWVVDEELSQDQWDEVVAKAATMNPDWSQWNTAHAAARAADIIINNALDTAY